MIPYRTGRRFCMLVACSAAILAGEIRNLTFFAWRRISLLVLLWLQLISYIIVPYTLNLISNLSPSWAQNDPSSQTDRQTETFIPDTMVDAP